MTYLELVNNLRAEISATGGDLTTLSGTLNGEAARAKKWINDAWREIQLLNSEWKFMRVNFSANLTDGNWDYNPTAAPFSIANLRNWKLDTVRCYTTGSGYADEQELPFWEYEAFKRQYRFGPTRTQTGRPTVFSVDPQRHFVVGPVPAGGWTVEGEYFRTPQELSANGDVPIMPSEYHMLIVYRAMLIDAEFEWSDAQKARAVRENRRLLSALEEDQLPVAGFAYTTA